jgi:hypothetical protein
MVLRFNGELSGAGVYSSELMQVAAGGVSGSVSPDARIGNATADCTYFHARIMAQVLGTDFQRCYEAVASHADTTGVADAFHQRTTGVWTNDADNLVRIDIGTNGTDRMLADSEFYLYRRVPA